MIKKLIAIALVLAASFMIVAPTKALTAEELQQQINALLAQIQILQAQLAQAGGSTGGTAVCSITSFTRNLSQGATGDDVKCLQIILNMSADTQVAQSGAGSPGSETTYFGALTKAAVVKFQNKYASEVLTPLGLTQGTGFVGAATRAKLNTMIGGTPPSGTVCGNGVCETGETSLNCSADCVAAGPGLTVALASDNPAAGTIVSDSTTNDGGQAMVPMMKIRITNGDTAEKKVTQIKFKRGGISADTDIAQAYLYAGDTKLAEYNSFSLGVLTFTNSSGLFTVPAGGYKDITLKIDLTNGTAAGKTINFSLLLATDITSDSTSLTGTFPLTGSFMTTAQASDLGKLTVASTTAAGATVDPQDGLEVYNFTLQAQDQKLQIKKIVFTNMGSVSVSDLKNFKLYDGGTQLLSTIETAASDKTVTFDFGSTPLEINKGITKSMHLKADIVGGTNRTFQFSIMYQSDIIVYDTEYGVYLKPNASAWTALTGSISTINTGRLVLGRQTGSATGNVAKDGTNVSLAKFDVKAIGEDVKISSLVLDLYGTGLTGGLYQTKVMFDGSQKGSTANASSSSATGGGDNTYSFSNTFIVPADGTNHTIEIISDIKDDDGSSYAGGQKITASIASVTATGKTSLASVSSVTAAGNQLTIASGAFTVAKNQSISNWSATLPTGVPGQTEALVGAFTVTGGASEGVDITSLKIKDDGSKGFSNLQNLKLYNGTKASGTQIGTTQSSLTTGSTYTFYPSPYISLAASAQMSLYIYADVKTATGAGDAGYIIVDQIDGVGKTTNSSITAATDTNGQTHYIAASGALVVAKGDDAPYAGLLREGQTGVSFTQFKFTAGAAEDMELTKFVLTADTASSSQGVAGYAPTSTLMNIGLYDGSTQIATVANLDTNGRATFDLTGTPWRIPAGTTKSLMAKADVNIIPYATSGGWVTLNGTSSNDTLDGFTYRGAVSGVSGTTSAAFNVQGNPQYTYKTTVKVYPHASTPSGTKTESTALHVFYFTVENLGLDTAYFDEATVTIAWTAGTGWATSQADRIFRLYDYDDLTTWLASTTIPGNSSSTSITYNGYGFKMNLTSVKAIPAGGKKTFALIGDMSDTQPTSGGTAGTICSFYINAGTDFIWNDNVSASIANTYLKTFPVNGGTLSF